MTASDEHAMFLEEREGGLYAVEYRPSGSARARVLMCAPLFEERKSAHRVMVEAARALRAMGCVVLQFDYRGCGDSPGLLADVRLEHWETDLAAALARLDALSPETPLVLCGVRWGATLALRAAARQARVAGLMLWAPVVSGRRYLHDEQRLAASRQTLAFGRPRRGRVSGANASPADGITDLGGYPLSRACYEDLAEVRLDDWTYPLSVAVLLATHAPGGRLPAELAALQAALERSGARVETHAIAAPPFWRAVGVADSRVVVRLMTDWMRRHGVRDRESRPS